MGRVMPRSPPISYCQVMAIYSHYAYDSTVSDGVVGHAEPNWPSCHQNCSGPLGFFLRAIIGYNEGFYLLHMKKE